MQTKKQNQASIASTLSAPKNHQSTLQQFDKSL